MSGWKWVIQPLLTVERTVERAPGCWPLSSPCRRRRWPAGQALQGPSVPGHDRHRRTDGLQFKTMRSRQPSLPRATPPIRNSIEPIILTWRRKPSIGERVGTELEMEGDRHRALAAFLEPRRPVAAGGPHPAPLPSPVGVVDAAVQALSIEAQRIRHAQHHPFAV